MSNSKIPHFTAKQLDWDAYVKKFGDKPRTTDETYTPKNVYEAVYNWVDKHFYSLKGYKVVRPFFPGGNYEKDLKKYDKNTVVLDNPPFSQVIEIIKTYREHNIKFLLFVPMPSAIRAIYDGCGLICPRVALTFENGAQVKTFFAHNFFTEPSLIVSDKLDTALGMDKKAKKRQYKVPPEVLCVKNLIHWINHKAKPEELLVLGNPKRVKLYSQETNKPLKMFGTYEFVFDNKVQFGEDYDKQEGEPLYIGKYL